MTNAAEASQLEIPLNSLHDRSCLGLLPVVDLESLERPRWRSPQQQLTANSLKLLTKGPHPRPHKRNTRKAC